MLIGITAPVRSGKDTVAKYLAFRYGFTQMTFAHPLKAGTQKLFSLNPAEAFDDMLKDVPLAQWDASPRELWCMVSRGLKHVFGDQLFVRLWEAAFDELPTDSPVVVSDVRTEDEAAAIRKRGGFIVHLSRPDAPTLQGAVANDVMHQGIQFQCGDLLLVNDGDLDDLFHSVEFLMESL
jgi:hypothetical protein